MRYRAKPLEIEAVLWTGDITCLPTSFLGYGRLMPESDGVLVIETLEGPTKINANENYVVRGTVGEFYPVRKDIFEAKYEAVTDE